MTETQKFWYIVLATFIGAWAPCAMAGKPGVGLSAGFMALLCQQIAVWLLFQKEDGAGGE